MTKPIFPAPEDGRNRRKKLTRAVAAGLFCLALGPRPARLEPPAAAAQPAPFVDGLALADVDGDGRADACRLWPDQDPAVRCDRAAEGVFESVLGAPLDFTSAAGRPAGVADWWLADVDGDGRADFCRAVVEDEERALVCDLATADGFGTGSWTHRPGSGAQSAPVFGDVDGDGRADLCRVVGRGDARHLACDRATEDGFASRRQRRDRRGGWRTDLRTGAGWDPGRGGVQLIDVTGDGRADVCRLVGRAERTHLACDPSLPDRFASSSPWRSRRAEAVQPHPLGGGESDLRSYALGGGADISLADINGDGVADLCLTGPAEVSCRAGTGAGWPAPEEGAELAPSAGDGPVWWADVDGDGASDACRQEGEAQLGWIRCDRGGRAGFGDLGGQRPWPAPLDGAHPPLIGDIDGDGRDELCALLGRAGQVRLACWVAGQSQQLPTWQTASGIDPGLPGFRRLADVDGDGADDFCRLVEDGNGRWLGCDLGGAEGFASARGGDSLGYRTQLAGFDAGYDARFRALPRFLADVDGDRRADFCRFVGDDPDYFIACDLAGPDSFLSASGGNQGAFRSLEQGYDVGHDALPRFLIDHDGDRRADFCRFVGPRSAPRLACDPAAVDGFASRSDFLAQYGTPGPNWALDLPLDTGDGFEAWMVDVDGDLRADLCHLAGLSWEGGVLCRTGLGSGPPQPARFFGPPSDGRRFFADIDADGRADLCVARDDEAPLCHSARDGWGRGAGTGEYFSGVHQAFGADPGVTWRLCSDPRLGARLTRLDRLAGHAPRCWPEAEGLLGDPVDQGSAALRDSLESGLERTTFRHPLLLQAIAGEAPAPSALPEQSAAAFSRTARAELVARLEATAWLDPARLPTPAACSGLPQGLAELCGQLGSGLPAAERAASCLLELASGQGLDPARLPPGAAGSLAGIALDASSPLASAIDPRPARPGPCDQWPRTAEARAACVEERMRGWLADRSLTPPEDLASLLLDAGCAVESP